MLKTCERLTCNNLNRRPQWISLMMNFLSLKNASELQHYTVDLSVWPSCIGHSDLPQCYSPINRVMRDSATFLEVFIVFHLKWLVIRVVYILLIDLNVTQHGKTWRHVQKAWDFNNLFANRILLHSMACEKLLQTNKLGLKMQGNHNI